MQARNLYELRQLKALSFRNLLVPTWGSIFITAVHEIIAHFSKKIQTTIVRYGVSNINLSVFDRMHDTNPPLLTET